jgi:hypothetical protein
MTKIRRADVQAVINRAAQTIMQAAGDDGMTTRKEINQKLSGMTEGPEKRLVETVFRTADRVELTQRGQVYSWNVSNVLSIANMTQDRELTRTQLSRMPRAIRLAAEIARLQAEIPTTYVGGTLARDETGLLTFTLTDGKALLLAQTTRSAEYLDMQATMMAGLAGDGPVVLQGVPSPDGKTFEVEGFALNSDGKYGSFTFGRVNLEMPPRVVISTTRGDVEITDPTLNARLKAMPRFGVILPGEPKKDGDKLVYQGNPEEFFGLARFTQIDAPKDAAEFGVNGKKWAPADMAFSSFNSKPLIFPEEFVSRNNHTSRIWVRGNVRLDDTGVARDFTATYVSKDTDGGYLSDMDAG